MNSKFTTFYYIVNTTGRKGIGIGDIDRGRIIYIFFLQIVQILVYCYYIYISIGHSTVCLTLFCRTLKQTSKFRITGPLREEPVTTQRASNVDIVAMCNC